MVTVMEITCINKIDRTDIYSPIEKLGGKYESNNSYWEKFQDQVITDIHSKIYIYFIKTNNVGTLVSVGVSANGNEYLKSENNGISSNNLLSLPECPR